MTHETWGHRVDGIMTLLGYTIGSGAVIKFPYLVARNGGGAFFIPYIIFLFLCGLPIYYIEIIIGQYFQKGSVEVWNLSPAFKGLGIGACMIAWAYSTYSSVYYAWFFFYLFNSFRSTLPWTSCDNDWNTDSCISPFSTRNDTGVDYGFINFTRYLNHTGNASVVISNDTSVTNSVQEFWRLHAISLSNGLHEMGHIKWPLAGCVAVVFSLFYLFMFKNIKIQGKIVYVTVILPVVLLTIFLVRGCLLPGALQGILFYIKPDFHKLKDPKLWIESCVWAFNSLGLAAGVVVTSASHNPWKTNCFRAALTVCVGDLIVATYAGFAVFSVLGHLAYLKDATLEGFQTSGYDIAFITLPETVGSLPIPQLWAVLFFVTLITFGFDSTVPCLEIIVTVLGDWFPNLAKRRWLHVGIVIVPSFIVALMYTFQGGMYLLTLIDWFIWGPPITLFSVLEALVIGWIFGIPRLSAATKEMYDRGIPTIMKILTKFVSPVLLMVIFCYSLHVYRPPKYGDYVYPGWANAIGWIIVAVIILPLPTWMCYTLYRVPGKTFKERLTLAFRPEVPICRQKRGDKSDFDGEMTQTF